MKTRIVLLILITMVMTNLDLKAQSASAQKKVLVAYYSHSGNTRIVANQIAKITGGDIFEIQTVQTYHDEYNTLTGQARNEINENYRPELKTKVENIDRYDVILIGSPCWWSTVAPAVSTFLSSYDLSGKTIAPFMTHEGSRMGRSVADIKALCPNSTISEGLPVRGYSAKDGQGEVVKWLRKIAILN